MSVAELPPAETNRRHWRACLLCGLIKTREQFRDGGCENCDELLNMQGSSKRVADCTSAQFDGIIAIAQPGDSWVARWQRCDRSAKGLYAMRVTGRLPEDISGRLEDQGFTYRPRDGSVKD
ncbi:transcription elongation factor spt4 [Entophlyctis luteolus]|nr:transcription elongation factor spt4 [Entophlyctis luteolus]KAJ3346203.1 transcription elongation factor spt4 [Entophlyctis luteolus]KAJ3385304.1 transcription elongation factor spt4 [Entophlyctis sp. JEL0112]